MPELGGPVLIDYLSVTVAGTVRQISDGGRQLEVVTEEGTTIAFTLNRATATFTADGGQTAPRLRFTS